MAQSKKTVAVTCKAAGTVSHKYLKRLQGDLKVMDDSAAQSLKDSILRHGISFPFHVWKDPKTGDKYIVDAHQRLTILERLEAEGFDVPEVPVAWIEAADRKEALLKCAVAASQYGTVTSQGLFDFMKEAGITADDLGKYYRFPEINMDKFMEGFFPEIKSVTFNAKTSAGAKEINTDEFEYEHKCPKCGFQYN